MGLVVSFRGLVRAGVRAGRALGAGCSEPCLGALEASPPLGTGSGLSSEPGLTGRRDLCPRAEHRVEERAAVPRERAARRPGVLAVAPGPRTRGPPPGHGAGAGRPAARQGEGAGTPGGRGRPGEGDARGTGTPGEQGRPGPHHSPGGQGRPGDGDARGLRHSPRGQGRPGDRDARGPATRPRSRARTLHLANTVMLARLRARAEFTGAGVPPCFLPGDTGCRLQGPRCTQCEVPRAHVPSCRPAFRVPSYHRLSRNLLQFR